MAETRKFHLGDILSVTTGLLVSPRHMDGVNDILCFMTGESLFTHQIPRAGKECAGPLLAQHPDLAGVDPLREGASAKQVEEWLAAQVARFGRERTVKPLAAGVREKIDPMTELINMRRGR